jgi:hypothetical protein
VTTISVRALNRATLARQMLLRREAVDAKKAVERLAGLQAQVPKPPFIALWSRLEDFDREELRKLIAKRELVRATMMRGTIHLMTTKDFLAWRLPLQPVLSAGSASITRGGGAVTLDTLVKEGRRIFTKGPAVFEEVRQQLVELFPGENDRLMGYAVRMHVPLVMVPDDSRWSYAANAPFALAETFAGKELSTSTKLEELVTRYLAAFGPATIADFQAWSGLRGAREPFEALRGKLDVFTIGKREYFDVAGAPRPDEDAEAPVRFLPDYDNATLGYGDKSRIVPEEHKEKLATNNLRVLAVFLVDGFVAGTWSIARKKGATLTIAPFTKLTKKVKGELEAEGERLLRFVEEDAASFDVKFA